MAEIKKRTCFVITPVGDEEDPIRRHIDGIINAVLTPVLGDEYEIVISHKLPDTRASHKQIIRYIYDSDLVIANLTQKQPVVIYELAFRHSIGTPVIMIAEKGTNLPYFFADKTIYYINDAQGVLELIEKLVSQLDDMDFSKDREGPIYDALRDTSKEEYLVKKIEKEYQSLADMGKGDEIAEISETEYAFFRDLLREENKKPVTTKPEYDDYIPKEEVKIEEPTIYEQLIQYDLPEQEIRGITQPVTLENISRSDFSIENEKQNAETDIFRPEFQSGFTRQEKIVVDEPEFDFLNDIMSNDLPEKADADFESLREILKDTKKEVRNEPEPNTLISLFKEDEPDKREAVNRGAQDTDILDKLDRIENKLSNVVLFNENHFYDLIEKNEYLNKLIKFNNLYNELNGIKANN